MPSQGSLFEYFAKDCARAGDQTDNPTYREQLLKMARDWMQLAKDAKRPNR
jgi:hypothetical protein